jgi:hypothetical protein
MRRLLQLPIDFHLNVRNFLILDKSTELAFDADALLLLPARSATRPVRAAARARTYRLSRFRSHKAPEVAAADCEEIKRLEGHELFLPRAAEGHTPFMRLLAWKAVSALRAGAEAADAEGATADFRSGDVAFDASLESGSAAAVRMRRTVDSFASVGLVFAGARAAAAV